jgi:hypothetical protein
MLLRLQRGPSNGVSTLGELFQVVSTPAVLSDRWCFTLEDVIRELPGVPVSQWKVPGATAIPEGTYKVVLTPSWKFKTLMPELLDVPGFDGIRIHAGNTSLDTEGCILVGMQTEGDTIVSSRPAFSFVFDRLMDCQEADEPVWIEIRNP